MIQQLFIPLFAIAASLDVGAKAANLTKWPYR